MWTNSHHLNLFYYVARYGGISNAARAMPYGISASAISLQMAELEAYLGAKLFRRKPFSLLTAGRMLYRWLDPLYSRLPELVEAIRNPGAPGLRVGISEVAFNKYLPHVIDQVHRRLPSVRFDVQHGPSRALTDAVERGELDIAFVALPSQPVGPNFIPITRLPIVLLAHAGSRRQPRLPPPDLSRPGRLDLPLIAPAEQDSVWQVFQAELARRKIVWSPTIAVNSISLISWFVAERGGFSVCLDLPVLVRGRGVRVYPLHGFPRVEIVAAVRPDPEPTLSTMLDVIREQAAELHPAPERPPAAASHLTPPAPLLEEPPHGSRPWDEGFGE